MGGGGQNQHNIRRGFVEYIRCTSACMKTKHINASPKIPGQSTLIKTLKTTKPCRHEKEIECGSFQHNIVNSRQHTRQLVAVA